ncbi:MAG: alpha/beta hydrolase [Methylococcaceae bacterium]|nr:alpha/beta hydrolase [Methylococcaceae bacterium]
MALLSKIALYLVAGYAVLLAGCAVFQRQLLYFPTTTQDPATPEGFTPWVKYGELRGYLAEPEQTAKATAVVFHGNAGHAGERDYYAAALAPLGLRVILAEYPGYGPRPGRIDEESLVADARRTLAQAGHDFPGPLLALGESLGAGGVAGAVADPELSIAGLMLITPWNSLVKPAQFHYPWLPVDWILQDRYDSTRNLAQFARPVLVAVAEQDSIVPARFGTDLYQSLTGTRQLRLIPKADHNDWFFRVDASWWQDSIDFLLSSPHVPKMMPDSAGGLRP